MARLLRLHLIFEEDTQGEPRGELYDAARRKLEKRLMIHFSMGSISFTPLAIKKIDDDGNEREIFDDMERIECKRDIEEKGFTMTGSGGTQFSKKER